jgi:hypothetical protein
MYKIHVPHRESGYITKIEYQETTDAGGVPDWEMLYTPGPKAVAEFEAFTNRQARLQSQTGARAAAAETAPPLPPGETDLLAQMVRRGISEKKSRELLANLKPSQEVMDQLEYVDSLIAKDSKGRVENPPGLYVFYIRDNIAPPADFQTSRKRRLVEEAQQARANERINLAQIRIDYEAHCASQTRRYIDEVLPEEERRHLFEQHARMNRGLFRKMGEAQLQELTESTVRLEVQKSGRVHLPSFEEFRQARTGRAA